MGAFSLLRLTALGVVGLPASAHAFHDVATLHEAGVPWNFEPWLVALLLAAAILYARGLVRLWRKAGVGRGIGKPEAIRFALGWGFLCLAFLSPIDVLAPRSFTLHMVQHELLMVVAAPLLVMSRPLEAWTWALPPGARHGLAAIPANLPWMRHSWSLLTGPPGAWCAHALALWLWHVPALFSAALADQAVHVLQHLSFFASALAFWWAVIRCRARRADAISMALLFTTMLHTTALGALLAIAPSPWYADGSVPPLFGLSVLEDQQLGGLLMWVPGSLAYLVGALVMVRAWLSPGTATTQW